MSNSTISRSCRSLCSSSVTITPSLCRVRFDLRAARTRPLATPSAPGPCPRTSRTRWCVGCPGCGRTATCQADRAARRRWTVLQSCSPRSPGTVPSSRPSPESPPCGGFSGGSPGGGWAWSESAEAGASMGFPVYRRSASDVPEVYHHPRRQEAPHTEESSRDGDPSFARARTEPDGWMEGMNPPINPVHPYGFTESTRELARARRRFAGANGAGIVTRSRDLSPEPSDRVLRFRPFSQRPPQGR